MSKKRRELSEDEAWEIALNDHPEWRREIDDDELPDEIIGEDGQPMNPRLHLSIHAIVERQLASDEPKGVAAVAEELSQLGLSRHEIRHEIGRAVADQIGVMLINRVEFDVADYLSTLRQIVQSHR